MNNKSDFQVRIIDFYNDIDKPIINNLYNNQNLKNILELSVETKIPIFKKDKHKLRIKDKRKLLKEADIIKKQKIKEITTNLNNNDDIQINNKLMSEIETINNFRKNIESNNDLSGLQFLGKKNEKYQIKIVDIIPEKSDNDDYIEVFSN
jgi:hypothetical protein